MFLRFRKSESACYGASRIYSENLSAATDEQIRGELFSLLYDDTKKGLECINFRMKTSDTYKFRERLFRAVVTGHGDNFLHLLQGCKNQFKNESNGLKWENVLSIALSSGQSEILKILLDDIHFSHEILFTKLKWAAERNNNDLGDCIQVLLEKIGSLNDDEVESILKPITASGNVDLFRVVLIKLMESRDSIDYTKCWFDKHIEGLPFADAVDYSRMMVCLGTSFSTSALNDSQFPSSVLEIDGNFEPMSSLHDLVGYGNVERLEDTNSVYKSCHGMINGAVNSFSTKQEVRNCGSTAEGTKVCLPDEMDYLVLYPIDQHLIHTTDLGHGYKGIKPDQEMKRDRLQLRLEGGSKKFHDAFAFDITLSANSDRQSSNCEIRYVQIAEMQGGCASTKWVLRYVGCEYLSRKSSIDVCIDIVPVLHVTGWPEDAISSTWLMDHDQLKQAGYLYVANPPSRESEFGKSFLDEEQEQIWRLSYSHLEVQHLSSLDQRIKDVYITAKCIRNPDICHILFRDTGGVFKSFGKYLVTYLIKMVFMHNVKGFLTMERKLEEMVYMVYSQLEKCISQWFVPSFWQPQVNVLHGSSLTVKKCQKAARIMKALVRKWYMRDCGLDQVVEDKHTGVYVYLHQDDDETIPEGIESADEPYVMQNAGYNFYKFK